MVDSRRRIDARRSVTLSEPQLAELAPFGTERAVAAGDVLYAAGDDDYDFFVVLDGEVEIVRRGPDGDEPWSRRTAPAASSASSTC